jgi:hypothetical protein
LLFSLARFSPLFSSKNTSGGTKTKNEKSTVWAVLFLGFSPLQFANLSHCLTLLQVFHLLLSSLLVCPSKSIVIALFSFPRTIS